MKAVRWLPLVIAALVAACGPWGGTSPAGGPPRVIGSVTAGPVCPVQPSPPDPRCAPRPVAGAVVVATNAAGQEVGRATSAGDGSFELMTGETGTLRIAGLPVEGLMGQPQPVEVTLTSPSSVKRINLEYDTGIR